MKLTDLEDLNTFHLEPGQCLYRIQRAARRSPRCGPLNMAPPGLMSGRFDLPSVPCAYFGSAPETALYESLFRREAKLLSMNDLRLRELIAVEVRHKARLADFRPHSCNWPVLQSLRFSETQELAADVFAAGFGGVIYSSAQHSGQDCVVLFDPKAAAIAARAKTSLVGIGGTLNRFVVLAAKRSKVPLVP